LDFLSYQALSILIHWHACTKYNNLQSVRLKNLTVPPYTTQTKQNIIMTDATTTTTTTTNPVMVPTKRGVLKKELSFKPNTKTGGPTRRRNKKDKQPSRQSVFRNASYGSHGHVKASKKNVNVQSLTYVADESDVWRAHWAMEHYMLRGEFWNHGKFKTIQAYFWIVMTGVMQACVAYAVNMSSKVFIEVSFCILFNFCIT
jgi:hypothetical protein